MLEVHPTLEVHPINAFDDNYIWLIKTANQQHCWVVDPGDAAPVKRYLQANNLTLDGILLTHHHNDHIGGVVALAKSGVAVVGFSQATERLPVLTQAVQQGDTFELLGHKVQVLEVPGHTLDHLVYFITTNQQPLLFSGDTLFAGGCGRMFEGTPQQMYASLQSLAVLPADTQVFAAHEYTLSNLKFALLAEPNNEDLQQRIIDCNRLRAAQQPTLPSTIAAELATNPFLRVSQPAVIASLQARHPTANLTEPTEAFRLLRAWKDTA